ncbi:invasion outer membrane protein Tia [Escherichia coli]|uniref:invasion outer membrane protein Tia n=1 Tax=Escherichia coli TaxID=562 RepID=UPI000BE58DEC|nr:invasion outer membrane protein Tia [Escherichia coli]MBB7519429.1 porin family protein [Escherichia coli]HBQ4153176.1 porin family protein [Escherichia coli]
MKKIIAVSALAVVGMFSGQALADRGKTGFYVTGKAGASVVTQTDQRFRQDFGDDVYKYKGGDKNDTIFGAGLAVGYDFYQHYNVPVRTEVEFYGRGAADSRYTLDTWYSPMVGGGREDTQNRLSVNTLMVNTYYDFRNSSAFTPWVSVGLGYARIHHKATYTDTSWNKSGEVSDISALHYPGYDNNFAWSFGAGVRYDVTPDIALDLSYRYLDAGDASVSYKDEWGDKYKSEVDVKSHDIMLGVTYKF